MELFKGRERRVKVGRERGGGAQMFVTMGVIAYSCLGGMGAYVSLRKFWNFS